MVGWLPELGSALQGFTSPQVVDQVRDAARYRDLDIPKFFRGDAAFAGPKLLRLLEQEVALGWAGGTDNPLRGHHDPGVIEGTHPRRASLVQNVVSPFASAAAS